MSSMPLLLFLHKRFRRRRRRWWWRQRRQWHFSMRFVHVRARSHKNNIHQVNMWVCARMKHLNLLMHLHSKCIHSNTYATKMLRVYCLYVRECIVYVQIYSPWENTCMSIKYNSFCLPFIWHIWHQVKNIAIDLTSSSHLRSLSLSSVVLLVGFNPISMFSST